MNKQTQEAMLYAAGKTDGSALIKAFDRLVHKIVIARWGYSEDLIQEGRIAVLEAAELFDSERGTEFSTFVFHRITHAVNSAGPQATGNGAVVPWGSLNKYRQAMRHANGDVGLAADYAIEELGMSAKGFTEIHLATSAVDPSTLDHIPDIADKVASADYVDTLLDVLDADERYIFSAFYGLDAPPVQANELTGFIGGSQQDVRNMLARCRRKLRKIV